MKKIFTLFLIFNFSHIFAQGIYNVYMQGDNREYQDIASTTIDNSIDDIIERGFTHIVLYRAYNNKSDSDYEALLKFYYEYKYSGTNSLFTGKGIKIIASLHDSYADLGGGITEYDYSMKHDCPFTSSGSTGYIKYGDKYDNLLNFINKYGDKIDGIYDDIEVSPFTSIKYENYLGENDRKTVKYNGNRIYSGSSYNTKIYPRRSFNTYLIDKHGISISGMDLENIQFNNSMISHTKCEFDITQAVPLGYQTQDGVSGYHAVAQLFKPTFSKISKIEIMIKRALKTNSVAAKQKAGFFYYIAPLSTNGYPQGRDMAIGGFVGYTAGDEVAYLGSGSGNFSTIDPLKLYFNPDLVKDLDVSKSYALVLELNELDYDLSEWNGSYFAVAKNSSNKYLNGRYMKGGGNLNNIGWVDNYPTADIWFKVYYPSKSYFSSYNFLHREWVNYQTENMALILKDYKKSIISSTNNNIKIFPYSGYQDQPYGNQTIKERYSTDWGLIANELGNNSFIACAGYGYENNGSYISATKALINSNSTGNYLIGGVLGFSDTQGTLSSIKNKCDGILYYLWNEDSSNLTLNKRTEKVSVNLITNFSLIQNYPNPFNPSTVISYSIPVRTNVSLKVYNSLGQRVVDLKDGVEEAGKYNVIFNASSLSSGIYYYTLRTNDFAESKKMLLIK